MPFGTTIKTPLETPTCHTVLLPILFPVTVFQEAGRDGLSTWVPSTTQDPYQVPDSWLQPGTALAIEAIWKVTNRWKVSLCFTKKLIFKEKINKKKQSKSDRQNTHRLRGLTPCCLSAASINQHVEEHGLQTSYPQDFQASAAQQILPKWTPQN